MNDTMDGSNIVAGLITIYTQKLFSKVTGVAKDKLAKFKIDFEFAYENYLTDAYDRYSKVKTVIYRTQPKYIYDFFVNSDLAFDDQTVNSENINNILDISNYILLEGTGGIGKSTLMKHFFLNALDKKELVPIFVELKDVKSDNLLDYIYNRLGVLNVDIKKEYLDYALKSGCFLFLFDGLDEVNNNHLSTLIKEIEDLTERYDENYYIVSSRPNNIAESLKKFSVIEVQPLRKEQSIELIKKIEYEEVTKEKFIEQLDKNLYNKHISFASNPLLLNMMLLTFDSYAEIPDKIHVFYGQAFETMFCKHDSTKGVYKREHLSNLEISDFIKVFSNFCFTTYMQQKYQFTYIELNNELKKIANKGVTFGSENYIKDLKDAVCVLYEDGQEYIFTHRSFQEYFAAVYIKELSDQEQKKVFKYILENNIDSDQKVLGLLYDMMKERFENNLLLEIVEKIEKEIDYEEDRYDVYFDFLIDYIEFTSGNNKNGYIELVQGIIIARKIVNSEGEDENEKDMGLSFLEKQVIQNYANKYDRKNKKVIDHDFENMRNVKNIEYHSKRSFKNSESKREKEISKEVNKDIYNFVKEKTWVGRIVKNASQLKTKINEKNILKEQELEEILNF